MHPSTQTFMKKLPQKGTTKGLIATRGASRQSNNNNNSLTDTIAEIVESAVECAATEVEQMTIHGATTRTEEEEEDTVRPSRKGHTGMGTAEDADTIRTGPARASMPLPGKERSPSRFTAPTIAMTKTSKARDLTLRNAPLRPQMGNGIRTKAKANRQLDRKHERAAEREPEKEKERERDREREKVRD